MAKIRNLQVDGYGNFQGPGWYDVKKFGAKGNNLADDRTAINAAIAYAQTHGGGTVFFPPGVYRLETGAILGQPSVSLVGSPSGSSIYQSHATNNTLVYSSGPQEFGYQYVKDLRFSGSIVNTGVALYNDSGTSRLLIDNCAFNGGQSDYNLQGHLVYIAGGASHVIVRDSHLRLNATNKSAVAVAGNNASNVQILNNQIYMPVTYTSSMVYLQNGTTLVDGNYFDCTDHNAGSGPGCISVTTDDTAHCKTISNNNFFMDGGPTTYGYLYDSGSWIRASGNTFDGSIQRSTSGFAAAGSTVDLVDVSYGGVGGTTATLPDCVASFSLNFTSTAPTITMPNMLFPGQEIVISVRNGSAGFWSGIGVTGMNGPLITNISGGQAVTFRAKVMTTRANGSTYVWTMVGQHTTAFTTT